MLNAENDKQGPTVYLNALRAFEAAGRLRSFVAAAHELKVSPPAVSQLIKSLEEYVGKPLFVRSRTGVTLTPHAQQAFPDIQEGFLKLGMGFKRLRAPIPTNIVTVSVTPAFASKWLLPRIESFREKFPQLDIRLDSTNRLVDFVAEGIDIGVRYGAGKYPGLIAERMMGERVYPVCSPRLLQHIAKDNVRPEDLIGVTLIHDSTMDFAPDFPTWPAWLASRGVKNTKEFRYLAFNSSALAIEAALDGQGIALGRSALVEEDIRAGRLVRVFFGGSDDAEDSQFAYYVVYPREIEPPLKVQLVRDWLLATAAEGSIG